MEVESMAITRSITVAAVGEMYWIRVRSSEFEHEASREVRHVCLRGLERGVTDIVIELSGVVHVSAEAVDMLEALADELRAKHGTLWLVGRHDESVGRIDLRHVPAAGLTELKGLSIALDEALHECGRLQLVDDGRSDA